MSLRLAGLFHHISRRFFGSFGYTMVAPTLLPDTSTSVKVMFRESKIDASLRLDESFANAPPPQATALKAGPRTGGLATAAGCGGAASAVSGVAWEWLA